MSRNLVRSCGLSFVIVGLGISILIALFLSPFASQDPDGLDRVATDLKFDTREASKPPAQQLPFHSIFDSYALRGVPDQVATPLAGLAGTLVTFGLAWGFGKLVVRNSAAATRDYDPSLPDEQDQSAQ